eukprot:gene12729-26814_t
MDSREHSYNAISNDNLSDRPQTSPDGLLGFEVLVNLHRDATLLLVAKIIRMFSFGFLAVMIVVYLIELGYTPSDVGLLFSLTLVGDAAVSLIFTSHADKAGRKKVLVIGAVLSVITSIIFTTQTNFFVMLLAGIFGVISPSGNEIGPFMAIELSALSQVTRDENRTLLMAWYNLFGCFSSALGALFCGWIISVLSSSDVGYSLLESYRIMMWIYTIIQIILCYQFSLLSNDCEVSSISLKVKDANPVSLFLGLHKSKRIVLHLCLLFMIDAFAGSFVLQSLISGWFNSQYHTTPERLGTIVFICNIAAGVSALFAAKLANVIGLILTMGLTHLPSNILLILIPLMPNEYLAIVILCARYSISQMDVPTRNAYVQGVVDPDERSAAAGVTNIVRSVGASVGPYLATLLYANPQYVNYPFYIAGGLKIAYDILLMISFLSVKPPEERAKTEWIAINTETSKNAIQENNA